jgi:acylaminoacyl-peptidase
MTTKRLVILFALLAVTSAAKQPLTPDTLWDWRTATEPQISPDGRSVVYVIGWSDRMNDAMYSNLRIVNADGKQLRPLTQGAFRDSSPRWSPDGTRLAYLSNRSGRRQIHVRWMDTGQEARITDLQHSPSNITWSPDGASIAFTRRVPGKPSWLVKMPGRPAGAKWADPPIVVTELRWRSDGGGILRPGKTHVFVVPVTGGTPRQVTSGDYDHGRRSGLAWTPDGRSILVSAQRIPDAEYSLEGDDIYAFNLAGGAVRQLTTRKGPDTNPTPSPDGKKIAYVGYDFKHQSYTVRHLYVMDSDGTDPRPLPDSLDRDVSSPRWSADSKTIYFTADDRGATYVYSVTTDGKLRQLSKTRHRCTGYGLPRAFSVAANGRVAAMCSTPKEPYDIITFTLDRPNEVTRLSAVNESLLADRAIGDVEEITYKSFDGRPIHGWIIKPPGFDPSKKYPLVLEIHGGPHYMYGVEFNHELQSFAGRGFVVLYTNPRGSTGYGEEFGNIIHMKYPGDDYKDLMAGVDVMLAKGYVDPKKLCVTGGSGGGLLTAWTIGQTDRFAAAVSQFPVTNWITQVGTADNGYRHAASWMKAMPWEKPQQYIDHSPIFLAGNFKTPTMVITGEADYRTPIAESEELYFALKARKVDSVLVRIPDEPHGMRGAHPSHRVAKLEHILAWLEKYTR